jgi:hypothetical protein
MAIDLFQPLDGTRPSGGAAVGPRENEKRCQASQTVEMPNVLVRPCIRGFGQVVKLSCIAFTRQRSLVRSQYRLHLNALVRGYFLSARPRAQRPQAVYRRRRNCQGRIWTTY